MHHLIPAWQSVILVQMQNTVNLFKRSPLLSSHLYDHLFLFLSKKITRIACGGNFYRGPSIDASYQISDQLALRFQRRRLKCEKLTDDRRRMPSDGKSSHSAK
jgi:hypothetical protein